MYSVTTPVTLSRQALCKTTGLLNANKEKLNEIDEQNTMIFFFKVFIY
jgi:hypothetical protein